MLAKPCLISAPESTSRGAYGGPARAAKAATACSALIVNDRVSKLTRKGRSVRRLLAIALTLLALVIAHTVQAQTGDAQFTDAQREAIRAMIREFILRNPETLIEALDGLDARRQAESERRAREALIARREQLLNNPANPVLGNPNGDATLIEFFDYRCPYCKRMHEPLGELERSDPRLRFVHIHYPVLGPDSVFASRAALAARPQNRYPQFHNALMSARGNLDEAAVMRIAASVGLDVQRLRRDMSAPSIDRELQAARTLAEELGISGTPAFVVADTLVPGAVDLAVLRDLIARARQR